MLRYSFVAISAVAAINLLLTDIILVQILLGLCLITSLGIAIAASKDKNE